MTGSHRVAAQSAESSNGSSSSKGGVAPEMLLPEQFPAGLRVLVVDDDTTCLRILEQMLRRCLYQVTCCTEALVALNILRERKGGFDVVLSDVHMPDMDGYKLLEHVGLEMDLPVIMMSADGRTSAVMKGIRHGACDYLIKPIREEELKNIWQHVIRKKWNENKDHEHSGSVEDNDRQKRINDDVEYASSLNEGNEGTVKSQKKRNCSKDEDDVEPETDDPSTSKKPRVVWSVELHQQFVNAVNQLGIDKAVPKRILELMNVPGLTRENVASHLQKFRLYLKRLSGVSQQQSGIPSTFCGSVDSNAKLGSISRFDIQALAASGQIPPQTLAALNAELLGRPNGGSLAAMDHQAFLRSSLQVQGPKCASIEHGVAYGQPVIKCEPSMSQQFQQSVIEDVPSGLGGWPSNSLGTVVSPSSFGGLNNQNNNTLMDILEQQQKQQQQQKQSPLAQQKQPTLQQHSALPEPSCSINVQPSCLVVPSQSLAGFQAVNSPSINQHCSLNLNSGINYNMIPDGNSRITGVLGGFSGSGSISPSASCTSVNAEQIQTSSTFAAARQMGFVPNICNAQTSSYEVAGQGPLRNLGFVGKGTCIPSRFAVDEIDTPTSNLNHGMNYLEDNGRTVKQEMLDSDYVDKSKVRIPILPKYSPNDVSSVFTR